MTQDDTNEEIVYNVDDNSIYYHGTFETPKYEPVIELKILNVTYTITNQFPMKIPNRFQRWMLKWFFGIESRLLNKGK